MLCNENANAKQLTNRDMLVHSNRHEDIIMLCNRVTMLNTVYLLLCSGE